MPADTHIQITDDGRVFGYVTHWSRCLLDGSQECWTPPSSPSKYALAHCGDTVAQDGSTVKTANLGGDAGHAPGTNGTTAATRWYQDTSTQLARVRYGEDENGIWFAGALWPDVSDLDIAHLRANGISGDWRWISDEGNYDFIGACMVPIPGLPLYRAASAGDHPNILGSTVVSECSDCDKQVIVTAKTASVSFTTIELSESIGTAFQAILLVEGTPTSDGRLIEQGAATWRTPPLSLMLQTETQGGHDGAVIAGRIDRIWRDGNNIMAAGVLDTGPNGLEAARLIKDGTLTGVSIDGAVLSQDDLTYSEDDGMLIFHRIEIMGATVTPFPAAPDAKIKVASAGDEIMSILADIQSKINVLFSRDEIAELGASFE